jgi:hypothetical protein
MSNVSVVDAGSYIGIPVLPKDRWLLEIGKEPVTILSRPAVIARHGEKNEDW